MIKEPPKLTIKRPDRRPTSAQIDAFQGVPTGFVVDALGGGGALRMDISPLDIGQGSVQIAGPAVTADNGPGDILATLAALDFLSEGDVLIATAQRFQGCAAGGDRLCGMARNAGAVALVTDGPVRDHAGLVQVGMPIWCTGLTPATPQVTGPGRVGLPVQIGGQTVATGDMVVADRDGVVVVPFARIAAVLAELAEVQQLENELDAKVAAGLRLPDGIAEILASETVEFVTDD